ncbi:hypothetical protein PV458_31400 [Streptomyces sp. MN03-5084-2B]|nr:hypothetical protein [Streptomyces sp. MN03-5084-2B]
MLLSEPTVRVVETGETYREVWSRQDDGGRRALLASAIEEVRVQKVTRGGLPENRPKPGDRIDIRWKGLVPAA